MSQLLHTHDEAAAISIAMGGSQVMHVARGVPARLYDHDLGRLVETVRGLGQPDVRVARTGTNRQHAVVEGMPFLKACIQAGLPDPVTLVDLVTAAAPQRRAS